jgi:hypothetical protein
MRSDLLRAAAGSGDRNAFYAHLTRQVDKAMTADELAMLLGELGRNCGAAGDWRGAADAFHHALRVDKRNKTWKRQYLSARRNAPDWGFHSYDYRRKWTLASYPDASITGIVAPIRPLVHGWLPASTPDTLVTFRFNGTVVGQTRAVEPVTLPDGNRYLQFARDLTDLTAYAGTGDTLSVEANGKPIPIINRGANYRFRGGRRPSPSLSDHHQPPHGGQSPHRRALLRDRDLPNASQAGVHVAGG